MPKQFVLGLLVSSAVLLSVVAAPAENINDALSKAYQKNSELNSIRADVRVADENIAKAKSGFRPTITGSAGLSYTTKRSNFSNRLTTESFGLQINQTLFDGFQTKNNVAAAEARSAASVEQLRSSVEQTLFSAAQAYMNVLHDRRAAVLTRQNLAFANEWVRSAKARMDVGEGTGTDVAQTEAFRANAVAAVSLADSQVKTSEAIYRRIVGDNAGKLEPAQPLSRLLPRNLSSAFMIANNEHPAILASAHLVNAAGHTVKSSEGALLPQETAEAGISEGGNPTSGSGGSVGSGPYGFGTSAKVGLNVRVPIYQAGKAAAQVRQSKESLSQSRIEVDVSRNEVRKAVADAWSAYESSRSNVRANKDNVSYTELALNGIVDERSVGQRTTLNVLEAQQDVINAKLNLIASERDLVLSTYAILQATGLLSPDRLGLDVAKYKPEEHYNAVKDKWIGIRTPDGR